MGSTTPDAREQTQLRRTSLREPGVRPLGRAIVAAQDGTQLDGRRGAEEGVARALAGHLQERRGRLVAETEARAADPGRRVGIEHDVIAMRAMRERSPHRPLQLGDHLVRAAALACDVIADMEHAARPGRCGQQRVKRRDAVRLGRRHIETFADVNERAFGDPPEAALHRLQRRQQQIARARVRAPAHRTPTG